MILILLFLADFWLDIVKNTKHLKKSKSQINASSMAS